MIMDTYSVGIRVFGSKRFSFVFNTADMIAIPIAAPMSKRRNATPEATAG